MKKHRLIFAGTPKLAVPTLLALINDPRFEIAAVVTQPDMPSGRNLALTPPPVKVTAANYGLTVFQPQRISHIADELRALAPEAIVVMGFSQLIPESVLKIPPFGCVNIHVATLPKYRGSSVIQAPILNGDETTGVTIMLMDKTLDTGPILAHNEYRLQGTETAESLTTALAELGAKMLPDVLEKYLDGRISPQAQDNSLATYVGNLEKKDGLIDWSLSAQKIERLVRALYPWPSAWTWITGKQLKILEVDPNIIEIVMHKPGKTFLYNSCLAVQCGSGSLLIRRLQLEGKKAMTSEELIRGYRDFVGNILG